MKAKLLSSAFFDENTISLVVGAIFGGIIIVLVIRQALRTLLKPVKIFTPKRIILAGAMAFTLCGLFPPWLIISHEGHITGAVYGFIFSSPKVDGIYNRATRLDIARLAVEWLCIAVATGTAWLLVAKPDKAKDSKDN